MEAVIAGAAYNGPPYWRYRRACIRYTHAGSRYAAVPRPGDTTNIKEEETLLQKDYLQTDYRPLQTTFQRTQTRSWPPSGPVRIQRAGELRTRHRA